MDLSDLVEQEFTEPELVPEILPVDARLSIRAATEDLRVLFARTVSVAAASVEREVLAGTSNVLMEAVSQSKGSFAFVRATATDGEKTVSVSMDEVTVGMPGSVLLPAARLNEIVKLAPDATTKIEVIGTTATIQSGRALWTVQVAPGDALSVYLDVSGVETGPVDPKSFYGALSATRRAASTSTAREALMQIQLQNGSFTACDGGRVHRARVSDLSEELGTTIPVGAADEILKALQGGHVEFAEFGYDDHHIVFETSAGRIVAQRMLVEFPPMVENLLLAPAFANQHKLSVDRRELIDTVKRVRINANPDSAAITLGLVPAKDGEWNLSVRTRDAAQNSSQETIACSWSAQSKPFDITLNHHYLLDLLEVYKGEDVLFKVGDDMKTQKNPLLVEDEAEGFTGVVQQMHSLR